jgi:hypothetical protein
MLELSTRTYKLRLPLLPIAVNECVAFGRMSRHALLDLAPRDLRSCGVENLVERFEGAAALAAGSDQLTLAHFDDDVAEDVTEDAAKEGVDLELLHSRNYIRRSFWQLEMSPYAAYHILPHTSLGKQTCHRCNQQCARSLPGDGSTIMEERIKVLS